MIAMPAANGDRHVGPAKEIDRHGAKIAKISWYFFLATLAPRRFDILPLLL